MGKGKFENEKIQEHDTVYDACPAGGNADGRAGRIKKSQSIGGI